MNWIQELTHTESLQYTFNTFLDQYGFSGLENALRIYSDMQQDYIYRTKSTLTKIKIADIYYLEIRAHTITIHTQDCAYQKYGSLTEEQNRLSPYGFIKCTQSCLVSVGKIRRICGNTITLVNGVQLHMSQRYTPKVLAAFLRSNLQLRANVPVV